MFLEYLLRSFHSLQIVSAIGRFVFPLDPSVLVPVPEGIFAGLLQLRIFALFDR